MSDIVERLRGFTNGIGRSMADEAADEIERLREKTAFLANNNAELRERIENDGHLIDALQAKIDKPCQSDEGQDKRNQLDSTG